MRTEALALNRKIIAMGNRSKPMKLKGPSTHLVGLKCRAMVPGFHPKTAGGRTSLLGQEPLATLGLTEW